MLSSVLETELPLKGVVNLSSFSVGELARLEQGQLIELPQEAIRRITLQAEAAEGPITVMTGKLGTIDRQKAIRLAEPPTEAFLAPLRRVVEDGP